MNLYIGSLFQGDAGQFEDRDLTTPERVLADAASDRAEVVDCLLPVQYFEALNRKFSAQPEGKLLLAVLDDAVSAYVRTMNQTSRNAAAEFLEVTKWFNARNQRDLFAFESICEVLGIDPAALRRRLRTLRAGRTGGTQSGAGRRFNPRGKAARRG
jgi:hypothetical protein